MPVVLAALATLGQAKSAEQVDTVFVDTFRYRQDGVSKLKKGQWAEWFGAKEQEIDSMYSSVDQLIRDFVYLYSSQDKESALVSASTFFEGDTALSKGLKKAMCTILVSHAVEWRESSLASLIGPPKLVDFDWRVDTKTASNHLARMAVPTVFVEMKVQNAAEKKAVMPGVKSVQFELSKQALATMLDGLGKIKDQLSSIS